MTDRSRIELTISEFNQNYPRPGIKPIYLDQEYDIVRDWSKTYPNAGYPGVYIFMDAMDNLLYIGKTSFNSNLGKRLGDYFKYGTDRSCEIKNSYYQEIRKIITIPLPKGHGFEAAAIEEYLIVHLNPKLNITGRNTSKNCIK